MSSKKIFVNLHVKDLPKAREFFGKLGYSFNNQFSDDTAACMVISEDIYAMLLTHAKFKTFIPGEISDAKQATEVLVCLSLDDRASVDDIADKAVAAGATTYAPPQDYGFMYARSFQDLDGHIWEYVYMDPSFVQES